MNGKKKIAQTLIVFMIAILCVAAAFFVISNDIDLNIFAETTTTETTTTEPTTTEPPAPSVTSTVTISPG